MPYFKVGGQIDFVTVVRAKDAERAEQIAIGHAFRNGEMYMDLSTVQECDKDGEPLETEA